MGCRPRPSDGRVVAVTDEEKTLTLTGPRSGRRSPNRAGQPPVLRRPRRSEGLPPGHRRHSAGPVQPAAPGDLAGEQVASGCVIGGQGMSTGSSCRPTWPGRARGRRDFHRHRLGGRAAARRHRRAAGHCRGRTGGHSVGQPPRCGQPSAVSADSGKRVTVEVSAASLPDRCADSRPSPARAARRWAVVALIVVPDASRWARCPPAARTPWALDPWADETGVGHGNRSTGRSDGTAG